MKALLELAIAFSQFCFVLAMLAAAYRLRVGQALKIVCWRSIRFTSTVC